MTLTDRRLSVLDSCSYSARHGSFSFTTDSNSSYSKHVRYINNTSLEIDFKERSGVIIATQPSPYLQTRVQTIEVEIEWRMTNRLFREAADRLALGHPGDPLLRIVLQAFDERVHRYSDEAQTFSMTLNVSLPLDVLQEAGGVLYMEELDVTFAMPVMPGARAVNHPFEPRERVKKAFAGAVPFATPETFLISLKAVNNDNVAKNHDRFMLFGGHVYRVPIERDPHNEDGIHIVRRKNAETDPPEAGDVIKEHLTFEEADKRFRLYDSVEMARKMGDPEVHFKLELAELQRQQKLDEIAQKRVDAEETARLAEGRQRLENERLAAAHRKAQEDLAKDKVKNFSDWMGLCGKFLLVALGAITTLAKLSTLRPA